MLEHPGLNKRQGPPPPRQEHPRTRGGRRPRLDHPWRTRYGEPQPQNWNIQGGRHRRSPHPPDWSVRGKVAARGKGERRPRPR